jgi:hypothetical protein
MLGPNVAGLLFSLHIRQDVGSLFYSQVTNLYAERGIPIPIASLFPSIHIKHTTSLGLTVLNEL